MLVSVGPRAGRAEMDAQKARFEMELRERLHAYWLHLCRDQESYLNPNFDGLLDCFSPYAQGLLDIRAAALITDPKFTTVYEYLASLKKKAVAEVLDQILPDKSMKKGHKAVSSEREYDFSKSYKPYGDWECSLQYTWELTIVDLGHQVSQLNLPSFNEQYPPFRFDLRPDSSPDPERRRAAVRRLWAAMEKRLPHWEVEWLEGHDQEAKRPSVVQPFPTPAGASWGEVRLRFTSDFQVQIWVRDESGTRNFAEMGFEDRRGTGDKPTMGWQLLKQFAECGGVLPPFEFNDSKRAVIEKQVQTIRKRLKGLFGIQEDPFHKFRLNQAYRAKFHIESPYSDQL